MTEQLEFDWSTVAPPKEGLVDLWTPDDMFAELISQGESALARFNEDSRIEYKSSRLRGRELGDYFSMWANTQPYGGIICLGIENDGTISGCLRVGNGKLAELEGTGEQFCPDAHYDCRRIQATASNGNQDFILAIRVLYHPTKLVETTSGEAYVRVGNRKRRLTEDEKREIRISKGQIAYEKESVNLNFPSDFDDHLLREFL